MDLVSLELECHTPRDPAACYASMERAVHNSERRDLGDATGHTVHDATVHGAEA